MRLLAFSVLLAVLGACGGKDSGGGRDGGGNTSGTGAGTTTAGTNGGGGAGTAGEGGAQAGVTANPMAGTGAGIGTAGDSAGTAGTGVPGDLFAGNNAVTPGVLCDRMATIQCAGEVACCDAPRTFEECKTEMKNGCTDMLMLDGIAMNAITGFDAAAANAAFTQYEMMARDCNPDVAEWGTSITGLRSILKGTVAPGKSCPIKASDSTMKAAAALASCTDGANTACMFHTISGGSISFPINWTCDPRKDAGEVCFTDANCKEGVYCDNPDVKFNATCKTRKNVGEACAYPNECATLFCKKKVCAAKDQQSAYCLRND